MYGFFSCIAVWTESTRHHTQNTGHSQASLPAEPPLPCSSGLSGRSLEPERTESADCRPKHMHQLRKMQPLLLPQGIGDEEGMNRKGLLPKLFIITLTYFALGFVSILFANLALLCMALPFILLAKAKKKVCVKTTAPGELLTCCRKKEELEKESCFYHQRHTQAHHALVLRAQPALHHRLNCSGGTGKNGSDAVHQAFHRHRALQPTSASHRPNPSFPYPSLLSLLWHDGIDNHPCPRPFTALPAKNLVCRLSDRDTQRCSSESTESIVE